MNDFSNVCVLLFIADDGLNRSFSEIIESNDEGKTYNDYILSNP